MAMTLWCGSYQYLHNAKVPQVMIITVLYQQLIIFFIFANMRTVLYFSFDFTAVTFNVLWPRY